MSTQNEDLVANWIKENGNPAIEKLTQINQETAEEVTSLLKQKGLDADRLALLVDIQIAEVTQWLNGKHNFSQQKLDQILATINSKIK
ncbi:hypothetical protein DHW03_10580 [Pedobacter yonginense]|uniref:XRE family transcriptional regulator n=1 Tax=Pedobacter yonginense TaxID=651869 RepID=A0A317EPZ2_9SPHI|nr:helix-turn-helix transcriptional regulator [Pedobacter yonginense]PWS27999.1 hypothetical protein DHW03_10580 [Pedobacter yonginense]